jgi:hypothetical protein
MSNETAKNQIQKEKNVELNKEIEKDEDTRSFSERHPNLVEAAKVTANYMAITAAMVAATLIVMEITKRYGHIKNDGTVTSMDQF